ncbi:MAG: glutathione binding-like protein [Myxococcales bacterium]
MKLYFSPLACTLASRIALYEAGAEATFVEVDGKTKRTSTGEDFLAIHPLGLVPALELPDGDVLGENAAVLQHIARSFPEARLAPTEPKALAKLQQYLCFIGTELHKALYLPLLDQRAPEGAKQYALAKMASRLAWLDQSLSGREFLLDEFSIADGYLFAVLNWSLVAPVDWTPYPAISAFMARMRQRPSIARAFAEELELYRHEQQREAQLMAAS